MLFDEKNGTELAGASARVSFVRCDVSDEKQILAVLDKVDSRFGRLDILVNDAAWQLNKPLLETTTKEFEQVMRINVTGSYIFDSKIFQTKEKFHLRKVIRSTLPPRFPLFRFFFWGRKARKNLR